MSNFENKFFSKEGQKERLRNVGATIKTAFDFKKDTKVVANVKSPTLKKTLETTANRPYATAGIAAGGITAARAVSSGAASSVLRKGTTAAGTSKAIPNIIKNPYAVGGLVGVGTGLTLSGGLRKSSPPQTVTPSQVNEPNQTPNQTPTQDNRSWVDQRNYSKTYIRDSPYAYVGQNPSSTFSPNQTTSQIPTQNFTPQQTASASSTRDWLPLAVLGGVLLLRGR